MNGRPGLSNTERQREWKLTTADTRRDSLIGGGRAVRPEPKSLTSRRDPQPDGTDERHGYFDSQSPRGETQTKKGDGMPAIGKLRCYAGGVGYPHNVPPPVQPQTDDDDDDDEWAVPTMGRFPMSVAFLQAGRVMASVRTMDHRCCAPLFAVAVVFFGVSRACDGDDETS